MQIPIDQDLETLDQLEAAPMDEPHPEQEEPFQHIPEDVIQRVDNLEIDLPQDQISALESMANTLREISKYRDHLDQTKKICSLEAQEMARFIPEVLGTEKEPVSFTSIPTSVGLNQTQQTLEAKQESVVNEAEVKMKKMVDRTIKEASTKLMILDKEYLPAFTNYTNARELFRQKTGQYPENASNVYVGEIPLVEALASTNPRTNDNEAINGSDKFKKFHQVVKKYVSYSNNFSNIYAGDKGGYIHFIDNPSIYLLDDLINKNLNFRQSSQDCYHMHLNDYGIFRIALLGDQEDRFKKSLKAVESLNELLKSLSESQEVQIINKIKQVVLGINLINVLLIEAKSFIEIIKACTTLMMELSQETQLSEVSAAMERVLPVDKPRHKRKNTKMKALLLRNA